MEPVIEPAATRDWQPSGLERAILILLGAAIFVFFFGVFTNISSSGETVSISARDLITALISLNALLVIHAWVHGLVMSRFGGTPRYGLKMIARIVPIAECTSPGQPLHP